MHAVFEATQYALISTAVLTALLHTLIPDHWLPFVLVGRARGWSVAETAAISGLSAAVHVVLSIALGLAALALGQAAVGTLGETLESSSHLLLIAFGVAYAGWSWSKGGHFHPGGERIHADRSDQRCEGDEGDTNPEHLHYHADDQLIRDRQGVQAWGLALIVGANPCLLMLPLMVETAGDGPQAMLLVVLAYALPTVLLMVGLSALGVSGLARLPVPGAARYMEAASGLLVAGLGLLLWWTAH